MREPKLSKMEQQLVTFLRKGPATQEEIIQHLWQLSKSDPAYRRQYFWELMNRLADKGVVIEKGYWLA